MRPPTIRRWYRLATVLGVLATLYASYQWRHYAGPTLTAPRASDQPTLLTRQVTLYELHRGRKLWTIQAQEGAYHEGQRIVELLGISLHFFQEKTVVVTITAPAAVLHTDTRHIVLPHGARGQVAGRGLSFSARRVEWFAATQILMGSGGVIFRNYQHVIMGDVFRADVTWQRVRLNGRVRARLYPFPVGPALGKR